MRPTSRVILLAVVSLASGLLLRAFGQARPARVQRLEASVFGGVAGTYTGLDSGRNLGFTGGFDLGFLPGKALEPWLEYRGTYAIDKGSVDGQKNQLVGLKAAVHLWRARPYANLLYGRGEISYGSGFQVPGKPIYYTLSSSNVLSPGGGVDLDFPGNALRSRFALKLDFQLQRYTTPVVPSGRLYAKSAMFGLVYRFRLGREP